MALQSLAGYRDSLRNALCLPSFYKASMTSKGAGYWQSLWTAAGEPAAGAAAGSAAGAACYKATTGSIMFMDATTGESTYLSYLDAIAGTPGTLVVYDRLIHTSALNGTLTTAQTIGTPALPRHTDGVGVEAWLEWYTATGSTAVTATLNYTDTADTAKTATASIIASPVAGQMIPIPLAGVGIKSAQSLTLSATTGTAGNFGITLLKRKAMIPLPVVSKREVMDALSTGLPIYELSGAVAFMVLCTTTRTGIIMGKVAVSRD